MKNILQRSALFFLSINIYICAKLRDFYYHRWFTYKVDSDLDQYNNWKKKLNHYNDQAKKIRRL